MADRYVKSISRKVRALIRIQDIIKASPDMPAKTLAYQRTLTKYSHWDLVDDIPAAATILTMLNFATTRRAAK